MEALDDLGDLQSEADPDFDSATLGFPWRRRDRAGLEGLVRCLPCANMSADGVQFFTSEKNESSR